MFPESVLWAGTGRSARDTKMDMLRMLLVSWRAGRPPWDDSHHARETHGGLQPHIPFKGGEGPPPGLLTSTLPPPKPSNRYLGVAVMRWHRRADPRGPYLRGGKKRAESCLYYLLLPSKVTPEIWFEITIWYYFWGSGTWEWFSRVVLPHRCFQPFFIKTFLVWNFPGGPSD